MFCTMPKIKYPSRHPVLLNHGHRITRGLFCSLLKDGRLSDACDGRRRNCCCNCGETEGNPFHREASDREDNLGGGQASRNDIVQAIVADRSLITALTSAILSNMDPELKNTNSESSNTIKRVHYRSR